MGVNDLYTLEQDIAKTNHRLISFAKMFVGEAYVFAMENSHLFKQAWLWTLYEWPVATHNAVVDRIVVVKEGNIKDQLI